MRQNMHPSMLSTRWKACLSMMFTYRKACPSTLSMCWNALPSMMSTHWNTHPSALPTHCYRHTAVHIHCPHIGTHVRPHISDGTSPPPLPVFTANASVFETVRNCLQGDIPAPTQTQPIQLPVSQAKDLPMNVLIKSWPLSPI